MRGPRLGSEIEQSRGQNGHEKDLAAKAAQAMLTQVFARELAPEVRVCGVAPGTVTAKPGTEERRAAETLLGRVGSPEDVAEAVVYLAGAGFVTGTTLFVAGGRSLQSGTPFQP